MTKHVRKNSNTKKTKKSIHLSSLKTTHAGIDIGAASIYVCIATSKTEQVVKCFTTLTPDLKSMTKWLLENKVKSVAMESTGVYWIPVYDILEAHGLDVILVNARHLKNIPARKTDVKDCQWIQELHSYGLLRGSFRPDQDFLKLRTYVRQRSRLYESASTQVQLMLKALTQMNVQINTVISDITSGTGLKIIRAILNGERSPKKLAKFRHKQCKSSEETIAKSLEGNYLEEHVFSLRQAYNGYEFFHKQVLECESLIEKHLEKLQKQIDYSDDLPAYKRKGPGKTKANRSPYGFDAGKKLVELLRVDLTKIPGIDANTAVKVISEIGTDMTKWKSAKHFCSWMGLCPGNKISGGKILSSRTKPTKNRVAAALRLAASTLYRSKTALGAFFRRMRSRLGAPKAITAAAHKLARLIYRMLSEPQEYFEYGEDFYENRYKERVLKTLLKRAKEHGFDLIPTK
jgi:transposase